MVEKLMHWLACPKCQQALNLTVWKNDGADIEEGLLVCACGMAYPIVRGIPRMLPEAFQFFPEYVATYKKQIPSESQPEKLSREYQRTIKHYSKWWTKVIRETKQHEEMIRGLLFARTDLKKEDFEGRLCLDAGCGGGNYLRVLSQLGVSDAVGLDLGFGVEVAHKACQEYANVHVVQGNILSPPFKRENFDRIMSLGVLHHTPNPHEGFVQLAKVLKFEGSLSTYFYYRGIIPFNEFGTVYNALRVPKHVFFSEPLRQMIVSLPHPLKLAFCHGLWYKRQVIEFLKKFPVLRTLGTIIEKATPFDEYRPLENKQSNIQVNYDSYSTPYLFGHSQEEIIDWYLEQGFDKLVVTPYRVSVTGTKVGRDPSSSAQVSFAPWESIAELSAIGFERNKP